MAIFIKMLKLLESNIQNLQNVEFHSCQIKLVYSTKSIAAPSALFYTINTKKHTKINFNPDTSTKKYTEKNNDTTYFTKPHNMNKQQAVLFPGTSGAFLPYS